MFTSCVFQIIAIFEEQGAPPVPHNGGDGTSASSVGTSSPDIFQCRDHINNNNNNKDDFSLVKLREGSKNDVIVTRNDLNSGGLKQMLFCVNILFPIQGGKPSSTGKFGTSSLLLRLIDFLSRKMWFQCLHQHGEQ